MIIHKSELKMKGNIVITQMKIYIIKMCYIYNQYQKYQ